MSNDCRSEGRRRGAGQHRLGSGLDGKERAGKRVGPGGGDGRERSGSNSSGSSHGGGKGRNTPINISLKTSFQRSNSHDKVRKIVAEEGRSARNLIAWSVPLESKEDGGKAKPQVPSSLRSQRITAGLHRNKKQNASLDSKTAAVVLEKNAEKSPSKAKQPRKVDLRARYWAFLFDNLRRAVDEIYVTCESDQSVVECKEVLMMLDNYVRDFKALIDWIQLQEKLEKTDALNRGPPPTLSASRLTPTGSSWADKVKSAHTATAANRTGSGLCQPASQNTLRKPAEKHGQKGKKDAEGWETVQRGRPARPRSAVMVAKMTAAPAPQSPKDDSDKENTQRGPAEVYPDREQLDLEKPRTAELTEEKPDTETEAVRSNRTRTEANSPEDSEKSGSLPLQEISREPWAETPEVHTDAVCPSEGLRVEVAPAASGTDQTPIETVKLESELDPTELSNTQSMAEVLAKKEELADRLEKANEEAIASAIAEEEQLTREIQAEENNDYNLEADSEGDFSASIGSGSICGLSLDWSEVLADYEAREPWRQSTSWGDIVEEEPARPPGHGIHMHEKLSSPSRKSFVKFPTQVFGKNKPDEMRVPVEWLQRADPALLCSLPQEKEVRKWKEELLDQRRKMMDEKLLHAEFKRELQLQAIVKKAQEEDAKVNEIAFINTLEAQNKRHDVLAKLKEYEQRLNELQEERQRRQEDKQARDEAVQERKRALEAERQARVEELLIRRKEQEARIELQRQERERAREDAARERARDREERLAALSAAQQEAMEELQKKIQQKHDESSRRHMEQIEQRKEKAAELSSGRHANTDYAPKLTPYERKKQCSLCNVTITSEVYLFSHIKGKGHQQAVRDSSSIQGRELSDEEVEHLSLKKYIVDIVTDSSVPVETLKDREEKQKARKKAKKLRARMNSRGKEYETSLEPKSQVPDSPHKAKLQRLVKDLVKQLPGQDSGHWTNNKVSGLDRTLGEISRILEKQNNADQVAFQVGGVLSALEQILQVVTAASCPNAVPRIPLKSLCSAVNTYYLACSSCQSNCAYVLFGNKITFLMDMLIHQLMLHVPDEDKTIFGRSVSKQVFEGLTTGLLKTTASVLGFLLSNLPEGNSQPGTPRISTQETKNKPSPNEALNCRVQDLISYLVYMGLIDKLYGCFLSIQGPVDENPKMATFLQHATELLHGMCKLCFAVTGSYLVYMGLIDKLYGCFLSIQGPVDENPKMATFLQHATELLHGMCKLCFAVTGRSPSIFDNKRQDPTGLTALLQSTDLVGVLHMLYCILLHGSTPDPNTASPVEGYPESVIQVAIHSIRFLNSFALLDLSAFQSNTFGDTEYGKGTSFAESNGISRGCDPRLIKVLFPTLISACYNNSQNKVILEQEMSCILLATFIQVRIFTGNREKVSQSLDYLELSNRFPREQWDAALQFFLKKQDN
ncbi:UNVERIFIED_CONTAM: hypothetical protein FKN15_051096 [Acipenser sinensis]